MTYTTSYTFDNLSLHAVTAPVACKSITLREQAQDTAPVAYDVAAPQNSNPTYRKYPGETVVFAASPGTLYQVGDIVGYIQPTANTVVFVAICE